MIELRLPTRELRLLDRPEQITYREHDLDERGFNRIVSAISVPTLTVYPAASAGRGAAAIVICPGGGYEYLAIDRAGHALARYFQQRGIVAAVLKCRLPATPLAPDAIPLAHQDAASAIRVLRAHAATWGASPERIGILGTSAGGHVAGFAAVFGGENKDRADFAALLSPVVTLEEPLAHRGSRERLLGPKPAPAEIARLSLERQIRPGLPPFFVAHAQDDTVVPPQNSERLVDALRRHAVPVEPLYVPTGGHAFSSEPHGWGLMWRERFIRWLDALG